MEDTAAFKARTAQTSRLQYSWDFSNVTAIKIIPGEGDLSTIRLKLKSRPAESQVVFARKKGKRSSFEEIKQGSIIGLLKADSPIDSAPDPYIGLQVRREFATGWFTGKVESRRFDEGEGELLWNIVYEDQDSEDVSRYVLMQIIVQKPEDDAGIAPACNTRYLEVTASSQKIDKLVGKLREYNDRWEHLLSGDSDSETPVGAAAADTIPLGNIFTWDDNEATEAAKVVLKWTLDLFDRIKGRKTGVVYDMGCPCGKHCFINAFGTRVCSDDPSKSHYNCIEIKRIP